MKDETYAFISDVKEKKVTARSARHTRTHCGKGGRVRLPSDNLSKKELMKMSGECKSYRLNDPMTWKEFLSMPDDIKVTYIKLLRQKFNPTVTQIAKMMGVTEACVRTKLKKLGLVEGHRSGKTKWDKEGFYAWWHGVDQLPTPVPEEPTEVPVIEEVPIEEPIQEEPEVFVNEDLPWNVPESTIEAKFTPFEDPDPILQEYTKENTFLKCEVDTLRKVNEELVAVHEKHEAENAWLRNELESERMQVRILEAQMDVVRLIFGGKNNG